MKPKFRTGFSIAIRLNREGFSYYRNCAAALLEKNYNKNQNTTISTLQSWWFEHFALVRGANISGISPSLECLKVSYSLSHGANSQNISFVILL